MTETTVITAAEAARRTAGRGKVVPTTKPCIGGCGVRVANTTPGWVEWCAGCAATGTVGGVAGVAGTGVK